MPIVTLSNIEKSFGQREIFHGLDFLIDRGERVGLIGDNGTGKTTLFKVITGEVQPESGTVAIAKTIKIGHLTQDAIFDPANTVMDEAELAFAELHVLSHRMRELEHEMAEHLDEQLDKTLEKYQDVQHEFELAGGYAWRHKLEATLLGVGLPESMWEQNVETLSGGQRSKLNLAKLLISTPDLLLLDEPTNHLDLAAIEWLEKYLLDFTGAVLLISHDRFLLDRLGTRIVWLTRQQLNNYPGNYSAYVEQRKLAELSQQRAYELQHKDIEKQKEFIRRFGAGQRSKEAKGREKRLNRLLKSDAIIDSVTQAKKINVAMETDRRAGDRVLEVRDLAKSFPISPSPGTPGEGRREGLLSPSTNDNKNVKSPHPNLLPEYREKGPEKHVLWKNVRFEIKRGERVGIIGPNGSGKTTMLRALMGEVETDSGTIRWGANLGIGYYDQRLDDFDPEASVIDETRGDRVGIKDQEVRDTLATMLFRKDDVDKAMGTLSGGERARVALAQILLDKPNVLLLDEPTNHLDINSREALESALAGYNGTIICVSHDRYFLDKTVGRLLIIDPPNVTDFAHGYSAYLQKISGKSPKEKPAPLREKPAPPRDKPQPLAASRKSPPKPASDNPYSRKFGRLTREQLEAEIAATESTVADLQQKFADTDAFRDAAKSKRLQEDYEQASRKLADLEAEYFQRTED